MRSPLLSAAMTSRAPRSPSSDPSAPTLRATGLSRVFGETRGAITWALRDVSLTVNKGEFVGVMGPSGSGKTTLLNLLAAIDTPTSGTVEVNGVSLSRLSDRELAVFRRRNLGFVFQDYNLLHTLSIQENVVLPLALEGVRPQVILERLQEVAAQLGIQGILHKRVYQVSGGEQQRAAIARAIIHRPALILADEPTGNLDSTSSAAVMEALASLNGAGRAGETGETRDARRAGETRQERQTADGSATILLVTHDPFAASFCSRILFLRDGRIRRELVRRGSRQEFYGEVLGALADQGGGDLDPNRPSAQQP